MAAPPASGAAGNGNKPPAMWRRADVVRFWEELIDTTDPDLAEELFFEQLLRDARAEQARRGWKGPQRVGKDDDAEEEQRRARVFQPWQLQARGSPPLSRAVVLGLRAPPHLASKHGMTPAAGPRRPPELVKKDPAV